MTGFCLWMLESSILVLMILGIRKAFMGKIRYGMIYALWLVVALRFLVPVNVIRTPFGIGNMVSGAVTSWQQERADSRNKQETAEQSALLKDPLAGTVTVSSYRNVTATGQTQRLHNDQQSTNGQSSLVQPGKPARGAWMAWAAHVPWKRVLGIGWLSISGMILCFFIWSNVSLMRRLAGDRTFVKQCGRVPVYSTSVLETPCLYGFFHPVIYLPKSLLGEEKAAVEQMITHEYVHYLHRDYIWAMLRIVLLSVYWFHPFVWIAAGCSKKDAELFCDEAVIRRLGEENRFEYGSLLIQIAGERHWSDFRYSLMPMSRKGREMQRRILAISNPARASRWTTIPVVVTVCVAVLLTCSTGIGMAAASHGKSDASAASDRVNAAQLKMADAGIFANPVWMQRLSEFSGNAPEAGPLFNTAAGGSFQVQVSAEGMNTDEAQSRMTDEDARQCEKLFERYVETFTDAINSGKTGRLKQVLAKDSEVYRQQKALALNYHKRGIREKAKHCEVDLVRITDDLTIQINSKEQIKVFYADASEKLVRQSYCYTCEKKDGAWVITAMEDNAKLTTAD